MKNAIADPTHTRAAISYHLESPRPGHNNNNNNTSHLGAVPEFSRHQQEPAACPHCPLVAPAFPCSWEKQVARVRALVSIFMDER